MTTNDATYSDDTTTLKRPRARIEHELPTARVFVPYRRAVDLDPTPTTRVTRRVELHGETVRIAPVLSLEVEVEEAPDTVRQPQRPLHPTEAPPAPAPAAPTRDPESLTYLETFLVDQARRSSAELPVLEALRSSAELPVLETRRSSAHLPVAPPALGDGERETPLAHVAPRVPEALASERSVSRAAPRALLPTKVLERPAPPRPRLARRVGLTLLTLTLLTAAVLAVVALVFGSGSAWAGPAVSAARQFRDDLVAERGPREASRERAPSPAKPKVVYFCPAPPSAQVASGAPAAAEPAPSVKDDSPGAMAEANASEPIDLSKRDLLFEGL